MLKKWLKKLPIPITKNHQYDIQAKKVIRQVMQIDSVGVDVGCHGREFLDLFLKYAPNSQHLGFEPLPDYYQNLVKNYGTKCQIFPQALSDKKGESTFNYVISNPAYSGLQKRNYDKPNEKDTSITVETDLLDQLIPKNKQIDFIKIDVEGAELAVLEGAEILLSEHRPTFYAEIGTTVFSACFDLVRKYGYSIFGPDGQPTKQPDRSNYFFVHKTQDRMLRAIQQFDLSS